jgi:cell division transport system permease protein
MARRKLDAKQFAFQKRKRRQWLTFLRMISYGVHNFSRNAWLTVAATAVMTITLLSIFMTLAARDVLVNTVDNVQKTVDLSIYVKTDTPQEAVDEINSDLQALSSVETVKYISPQEAREEFAKTRKTDPRALAALNESTNKFPGTFNVVVKDINDTSQLDNFTKTNQSYLDNRDPNRDPSFEGGGKDIINTIGSWVGLAERVGYVLSAIFVALSSLIIFNTIRMAIFNRKEEIQMMKLIGADRHFIRGPFIVEAVVYGFIAAVVATAGGIGILLLVRRGLTQFGAAINPTIDLIIANLWFVLPGMMLLGAIIGVMSSLLATRRYLKI